MIPEGLCYQYQYENEYMMATEDVVAWKETSSEETALASRVTEPVAERGRVSDRARAGFFVHQFSAWV